LKFYVNETYEAETETIPRRWSDSIETRLRHSKNASRPSRDWDVRDYNPVIYNYWKRNQRLYAVWVNVCFNAGGCNI